MAISSYLQEVWDQHDDSETYVKIRTCLLYDGATTQLRTIYFDNVLETGSPNVKMLPYLQTWWN